MAIDVTIRQKLFGGRTMPLEVILGDDLHYGNFADESLDVGELGDTEFVAYNPECIGRGFSVIWNPKEKKNVILRLPFPSTPRELTDFYAAVERMVKYWDAKLIVDGNRMSLATFLAGFQDMVSFNDRIIGQFSREVLDGEHDTLTLCSAMWPLAMGKDEAATFLEDPENYAVWLHEKQAMDAYYASPRFYMGEQGVFGRYMLMNDLPAIFPEKPTVPFGVTDPTTGKALECSEWRIRFGIEGEEEPLGEIAYSRFLSIISDSKKSKYDGAHFLLSEMTEAEIKALVSDK